MGIDVFGATLALTLTGYLLWKGLRNRHRGIGDPCKASGGMWFMMSGPYECSLCGAELDVPSSGWIPKHWSEDA